MDRSYDVLDFETYFSREYSLRRMTPVEYIKHPLFRMHGCAIIENGDGGDGYWVEEDGFRAYVARRKREQAEGRKWVVVSHNALFDMCILAWQYDAVPDLMIDTLGMARATIAAFTKSLSLDKVSQYLGFGFKGTQLAATIGMTLEEIKQAGLYDGYVDYALTDAGLCRCIFQSLRTEFPLEELIVMDSVIRCAVMPRFKLNVGVMEQHLHRVRENKQTLLDQCGMTDNSNLMSNEKFATALRNLGVDPPTKISLTTGSETYAFAKTDQGMADLMEHPNPSVQALVAARLGHKTTLEETRTEKFIRIARLPWGGNSLRIPIPLRYAGAHTHRLSGDWGMNMQNLGRDSPIRDALEVDPGYVVVAADASQIEARITPWLCGQQDLVDDFAKGVDIYSNFAATEVYMRHVDKKNNPKERFVGKQVILGCGFGVGWLKFQWMIKTLSRIQLGEKMELSDEEAQRIIKAYRRRYSRIPAGWDFLGQMLPYMAAGHQGQKFGPVTFAPNMIIGPPFHDGRTLKLYYPNLRQERTADGMEWVCDFGGKRKRLFGGKLMENIVQFLARIVVSEAARRMRIMYPEYPLALSVHDELVYVVREEDAEPFLADLIQEISTPPDWGIGLPLAAEGNIGESYGAAK